MDVPGCDDGSLVVVVGWASFLVLRFFLVEVSGCDDGSLVVFGLVFRVFPVTVISQSVITPKIGLSGNSLQSNGFFVRSTIFKLGSCSSNREVCFNQ